MNGAMYVCPLGIAVAGFSKLIPLMMTFQLSVGVAPAVCSPV
jgi:hypothetical protein